VHCGPSYIWSAGSQTETVSRSFPVPGIRLIGGMNYSERLRLV